MKSLLYTILLFLLSYSSIYSQCDNGSEPECQCSSAQLLCSVNELDGFSFSMSEFQHPGDGPDPLCDGNGVPNNPTWFSFIAYCEELTLTVEISNCTVINPPGPNNLTFGAQVGIYEDCSSFNEVVCEVGDCGNEDDKVVDLDGLTIGAVYHFVIDGCLGSACDVEISVDGMCTEEISDWTDGISGPVEACSGDVIDYTTDDLDGATSYVWFIDGNEDSTTSDPETEITWGPAGTYELCVDAFNQCVDITEDPDEFCITVTVLEPDAGDITATPNPLCPGETSSFEVTGFNEDPEVEEVIIVVDPNGEVLEVIVGGSTGDVTYDECGDVTIYSLNYALFEMLDIPAVGGSYSGTDCSSLCCDETSLIINFEDDEDPVFTNPPTDLTLICFDLIPPIEDLDVTDNCAPDALISGVETGSADLCDGGVIEREWVFADDCGNEITHVQTITIDPIELPEYINPPGDEEIVCSGTIPPPIDLMYTNNGMGACLVEGFITPIVTGQFDVCGSTITYEWDFTDMCGNNLNHVQTIEILPAEEPEFLNPPASIVIQCDGIIPPPVDLEYSNGDIGSCLDEGFITPTVDGNFEQCGTIITYEWDYTDACGVNINHVQTIEIEPSIEAAFINPPPDITLTCDEYNTFTFDDLDYENAQSAPCEITGTVSPVITDNTNSCGGTVEAFYEFEDDCQRIIEHTQTITVEPPAPADFISMPPDITVDCDEIPDPAESLAYSNGEIGLCLVEGESDPVIDEDIDECGGTITNTWEYEDDCNPIVEYIQTITINPAPEPMFESSPPDLDLTCEEFGEFEPEILSYTNNEGGICLIEGEIEATSIGVITECGGTIIYEWEYTDLCGRTILENQSVTVSPAPEAEFINVPSDMTVDCSEIDEGLPFLEYDNDESGDCLITGFVEAIPSGVVDECGGVLNYSWTFTDNCGRQITESQEVTFLPADEPEFIDPPEDVTVDCDEDLPDADLLEYDNDLDSPCEINGEVDPIVDFDDNIYTYTWTFTNACTGNTIEHVQTIERRLAVEFEEDEFEFQVCLGNEFDLSTIVIIDENNTNPEITFHDDLPADSGNEIDPIVILEDEEQEFFILGTNEFDCFDVATIIGIAEEPSNAGEDIEDEFCISTELLDLFSFLEFPATLDGEFTLIDGPSDLDFAFADEINISNAEPGIYVFSYFVESDNSCPSDESEMIIELLEPVEIELLSIACSPDGSTYTVTISNDNYDLDISDGIIDNQNSDEVTIINIPITQDLEIEAQDNSTRCEAEFIFLHPDCSCPSVAAPVAVANLQICEDETIPFLEVTVETNVIANWYDMPIGGNLLLGNSLTFQPTNSAPGIYTFYVEGESTAQAGCISSVRTPIQLEIIPKPELSNIVLDICDNTQTGFVTVINSDIESILFGGMPNLIATYYLNLTDLNNQTNAIVFPFTTTVLNTQMIFYTVVNSANCTAEGNVIIRANNIPVINPLFNDETCIGANDGFIDVDVISSNPPHQLLLNGDTLTSNLISDLEPGNYIIEAIDSLGCSNTSDVTISPGIDLSIEGLSVVCNDNATSTDASDDFYSLSFTIQNSNNNSGDINVEFLPQSISDEYTYGELITIDIPADGQSTSINVTDINLGCSIEQSIGELTPCSSECELILNELSYLCTDNGTPFDPSDDFYEFSIDISAVNGNPTNTYNLLVDDVPLFNFNYDEASSFTLPANNNAITIRVVDSQINNCFITEVTSILTPCSDACLIEAQIIDITCMDAGTLEDELDDIYSYTFIVNGTNSSLIYLETNSGITYNYDENTTITDNLILSGDLELLFQDSDDSNCVTSLSIEAPMPCSQPCTTALTDLIISDCNDNGTSMDNSDDTYEVSFVIENIDGDIENVIISDNLGNTFGPFNYNQIINIGPFPANATDITLNITDSENGTCLIEQIINQSPCSDACSIEIEVVSIECSDNGTQAINEDDLFSFDFIVTGQNVSSNGFETNINTVGNYSESITITDLEIVSGSITLEVTDSENNNCFSSIQIDPPSPCSQPCTIDFGFIDILNCNDNNTNTDESDDFFSVAFNINVLNGETSSFIVNDSNGDSYGPFEYDTDIEIGPFDANGNEIILTFTDQTNGTCFIEQIVSQNTCSNACQIEAQVVNVSCNDNGSISTNDDDIFTASIVVNGINTGLEFNIEPIGITGEYNQEIEIGPFEIVNGDLSLTINDIEAGGNLCSTTVTLIAPAPCSDPCMVELANLEISDCNNNGTGNISDDDLFSISFEISGLDGQGSTFNLRDNSGNIYGPFNYDILNQIDLLIANGSNIIFTLEDQDNGACTLNFNVSQEACSECDRTIEILANNTEINCNQPSITIGLNSDLTDVVGVEWTGPSFLSTVVDNEVSQAGTYIVNVTFIDGCTATDQITITASSDIPIAIIEDTPSINCDNPIATLDGSQSTLTNNTIIEWSDENGNVISSELITTVTNAGTYTLLLTDTNSNCQSNPVSITIEVFDNVPSAVIFANPGNVFDCFIESIDLSTEQQENVIYNWLVNNQLLEDLTITITDVADVSLIALDTLSLCETQSSIEFDDLTAFPIISLNDFSTIGCSGEETCIEVTSLQTNEPYEYNWFDENGNLVFQGESIFCTSTPGIYTIELTDTTNGCINENTFTIASSISPVIDLQPQISLAIDDNFQLQPIVNISSNQIASIEWEGEAILSCTDCLNPFILEFEDGELITLTIVSNDGCIETTETRINLIQTLPEAKYYIPNVFSMSDLNNRFTIFTNDEIDIIDNVFIYDRWGELVFQNANFEPNDVQVGWDGTFNNRIVEEGVYVYLFKFIVNGREEIVAGDVTFLR